MTSPKRIKMITVTDLHQSADLSDQLRDAVIRHRPDVLAMVGDILDAGEQTIGKSSIKDTAEKLARLPVESTVFVAGNHDPDGWANFVYSWPHEEKELIALYGTAHDVGPLKLVGFPCQLGWDEPWCEMLPKAGNVTSTDHEQNGRGSLGADPRPWLQSLLQREGLAVRTVWLMHEPPVVVDIADRFSGNPEWTSVVKVFAPLLTVSGHDHDASINTGKWHTHLGNTVCVNVGQGLRKLHYCVHVFEFRDDQSAVPHRIRVHAYPYDEVIEIPGSTAS